MKNLILKLWFLSFSLLLFYNQSAAQKVENLPTKWHERLTLSGYSQLRYNRLLETNPELTCEQCDKSLGTNGGFFLRRSRVRLSGYASTRLYVYLQYDMATAISSSLQHGVGLKDAYFDAAITEDFSHRIRFGQSKIPYGFENMQSSSNRLALDRNDAINSAAKDERDLGAFYMYTPVKIRNRLAYLTKSGLKGSGDYGMIAIGLYNGQGAGRVEANDNLHALARITYPFELKNKRIIETGIQAYKGQFNIAKSNLNLSKETNFLDERIGVSVIAYPQKLGFQAEYNIGKGPEYDLATKSTVVKKLKGGYAQVMYKYTKDNFTLIPFFKVQHYEGGKKFETDARAYNVKQAEIGIEWQFAKFELVAHYNIENRNYIDALKPINHQTGSRLRLQAQFNY